MKPASPYTRGDLAGVLAAGSWCVALYFGIQVSEMVQALYGLFHTKDNPPLFLILVPAFSLILTVGASLFTRMSGKARLRFWGSIGSILAGALFTAYVLMLEYTT